MLNSQVWHVQMRSGNAELHGEHPEYYVFARNAAGAERRGLALAKRDKITRPYCESATFICNVE
jgi:hypothetical protein